MQSNYEKYAVLDAEIKALTAQKDAVKADILTDMQTQGTEKISHALGSFTISKLKKWKYPEYITEAEDELKATKAKAESTGEATYDEQDSLRFTSVKI